MKIHLSDFCFQIPFFLFLFSVQQNVQLVDLIICSSSAWCMKVCLISVFIFLFFCFCFLFNKMFKLVPPSIYSSAALRDTYWSTYFLISVFWILIFCFCFLFNKMFNWSILSFVLLLRDAWWSAGKLRSRRGNKQFIVSPNCTFSTMNPFIRSLSNI